MSGTGVQSAMRRRMRPPEEPRRNNTVNANRQNTIDNASNSQPNNQRIVNTGQVLYMHQMKIQKLEKEIENLGVKDIPVEFDTNKIKQNLEEHFDKKLSLLNNNLSFLLNSLNEERSKNNIMKQELELLKKANSNLVEKLDTKLDNETFDKFKDTVSVKEVSIESVYSDETTTGKDSLTDSMGTMESINLESEIVKNIDESEKPTTAVETLETVETLEALETLETKIVENTETENENNNESTVAEDTVESNSKMIEEIEVSDGRITLDIENV